MKKAFLLCFVLLLQISCKSPSKSISVKENKSTKKASYGIVIHGGAGFIKKANISDSLENAYRAKLKEAILAGNKILENGGSAIEAVQRSINIMEDSPLFNSAKGAVLNHDEKAELDASIMDGKTLNAGAVASVTTIKNPINLAFEVMENSNHVLLSGKGAETFAKTRTIEQVSPDYFITKKQLKNIKRIKNKKQASLFNSSINGTKFGTVGCVALDQNGNLAAGTSTGGMANKKFGRIGDSPIIGAGTYANNKTCAVSGTGWGEYYIRGVVAYDISALMEYKGLSLAEAANEVIHKKQPKLGGNGGIIAIDKNGNISTEFNTEGMFRASLVNKNLQIHMFQEK